MASAFPGSCGWSAMGRGRDSHSCPAELPLSYGAGSLSPARSGRSPLHLACGARARVYAEEIGFPIQERPLRASTCKQNSVIGMWDAAYVNRIVSLPLCYCGPRRRWRPLSYCLACVFRMCDKRCDGAWKMLYGRAIAPNQSRCQDSALLLSAILRMSSHQ